MHTKSTKSALLENKQNMCAIQEQHHKQKKKRVNKPKLIPEFESLHKTMALKNVMFQAQNLDNSEDINSKLTKSIKTIEGYKKANTF